MRRRVCEEGFGSNCRERKETKINRVWLGEPSAESGKRQVSIRIGYERLLRQESTHQHPRLVACN
jgi:hypothetical protein